MSNLKFVFFAILATILFSQCQTEDPISLKATGDLKFEITDAPTDDANVKGVFVTVADVKVDGESFSGFSGKTTLDIMAYQNGNTELLGLGELEAGSYTNISLVLDYETDADGNSPGCYIWTADDTKESLEASTSSSNEIVISNAFEITADAQTDLVADFDLRKSIRYENNSNEDYSFVTQSEMNAAIRITDKKETGTIDGKCNDNFTGTDKVVVYAYAKGSYNRDVETKGQGSSNIEFKNAVTSSSVDASGNYQISFLEKGDYELVFAAYDDNDNDGKYDLSGTLEVSSLLNLDLAGIDIGAAANVTVNVTAIGVIPL